MQGIKDLFTAVFYTPLFNALIFLAWLIPGHSIGWAIIALTILIRAALLPSSIKTLEHQGRMRALQPKMDDLKKVHANDKNAHSKALMELYASEKVNPLGGCLPSLVQLPILLVIYRVFIHGLNTDQFNLLYSFTKHMDTINTLWLGIDLAHPEKWVMPVLAGALQFVQARQMAPLTSTASTGNSDADSSAQMMTKQMMYIFPFMTIFIARSLPAALSLYWITFSLFTIVQQWWFFRKNAHLLAEGKLPKPDIKTKEGVTVTIRQKGEDKE
jgi:YidC/Oxa1 family membrane protein insertase